MQQGFGTPTRIAKGGAVEEIKIVAKADKPCLLYTSDRKINPRDIDTKQLNSLRRVLKTFYRQALVGRFRSPKDIGRRVKDDLLKLIRTMKAVAHSVGAPIRPALAAVQLHHASLGVINLQRSIRFYRDVLGMEQVSRPSDFGFKGAWFKFPNGEELHLFKKNKRKDAAYFRLNHIAIRVTDFHKSHEWLKKHRQRVETYPTLPTAYPQMYLKDPDGNVIEINSSETINGQKSGRTR